MIVFVVFRTLLFCEHKDRRIFGNPQNSTDFFWSKTAFGRDEKCSGGDFPGKRLSESVFFLSLPKIRTSGFIDRLENLGNSPNQVKHILPCGARVVWHGRCSFVYTARAMCVCQIQGLPEPFQLANNSSPRSSFVGALKP